MPAESQKPRVLREKERKIYTDEGIDDDEIDGKRMFDVQEKLASDKYNADFVKEMKGQDVNVKFLQENGFKYPMVVKDKEGLGLRIPSQNFSVDEVKKCVGSRRMIDVLDVTTQQALEMTMKDWVKYYTNTQSRDRLLNVLSLECSHSRLENYVEQPEVVKQIDWVDTVWPRYLKDMQTETTNILEKMCYPKVQRYCLMSVKGCYTDFHIDMGGTSVWYHILHGAKVFWLVPPTEKNLALYEDWVLSGKQGDEFFPDKVEKAQKILLKPGWTFFIPTGWIHGVYTPEDSLVFGGNFIHSFNICMQLRIWDIENKTHVPMKFRYPFFTEMHWYVLERYVSTLTGKSHRKKNTEELKDEQDSGIKSEPMSPAPVVMDTEDEKSCDSQPQSPLTVQNGHVKNSKKNSPDQSKLLKKVSVKLQKSLTNGNSGHMLNGFHNGDSKPKVHLTKHELEGLRKIISFLENLAVTKKFVPKDIDDPDGLIADSKLLVFDHEADNPEFANTGEFTLKWAPRKKDLKVKTYSTHFQMKKPRRPRGTQPRNNNKDGSTSRKLRRRVRCKTCEPCTREDCRLCHFCKDMKKYGGPGVMKQCCLSRQCLSPMLPKNTECILCTKSELHEPGLDDFHRTLMECGFCFEITHPYCFTVKSPQFTAEGAENEDLPNSWECPRCMSDGKQGHGWKKEYPKAPGCKRLDLTRKSSTEYDTLSPITNKLVKQDPTTPGVSPTTSTCSSFSVSPDGRIHGNLDGLRQLSVKIERLRDIDGLSASPTGGDSKSLEFPKKDLVKPKTSDQSDASEGESLSKKEVVIETCCDPLEIKNTQASVVKNEPVKRKATEPVLSVLQAELAEAVGTPTTGESEANAGSSKKRKEGRLTRSSSVQSDSSQSDKSSVSGGSHNPRTSRRRPSQSVSSSPQTQTLSSQGTVASPLNNTDSGQTETASHLVSQNETSLPQTESKANFRQIKTELNPNQTEGEGQNDGRNSVGRRRNSSNTMCSKCPTPKPTTNQEPASGCESSAKEEEEGRKDTSRSEAVPVRRSSRRNREVNEEKGSEEDEAPRKRARHHSSVGRENGPLASADRKSFRRTSATPGRHSSSNDDSPVDGDKPKQAGSGSGQGQRSSKSSGSGSQDSRGGSQGTSGSFNGSSHASGGGSGGLSGGGGGISGGGGGRDRRGDGNNWGKKREPQSGGKIPDLKPCKVLVQKYVIRPAPVPPPPKTVEMEDGERHPLDQEVWRMIFRQLEAQELATCLRVCKTWYRWVMDHSLWQTIDLTNTRVTKQHLIGIVKRQPLTLNLNYSNISFRQLDWLVARLPCLRNLYLVGNSWSAVSALCASTCPMLSGLDVSWVTGIQDNCLKDLLSPPIDHRPGIINNTSRFHFCTQLNLTGSDLTDPAVEYIRLNLPKIEKLNLSCCVKLTNEAVRIASSMLMLREFDVSKCRHLTAEALSHARSLPNLKMLCILGCVEIDDSAIAAFTSEAGGQYYKRPGLVILP